MSKKRCCAITKGGAPCRVPFGLCDSCGECFGHCLCRAAKAAEARSRGGSATAKRWDSDLAVMDAPTDLKSCKAWLSALALGLGRGTLDPRRGQQAIQAVKELRESLLRDQSERLAELEDAVARLEKLAKRTHVV